MSKFKSVGTLGFAIVLCAGCHAMETPQADVPVLIEPDVKVCTESDPECRVIDEPVALDAESTDPELYPEAAMEFDTETSTEPIQGIISLDELKAHDQDADSDQQDGDRAIQAQAMLQTIWIQHPIPMERFVTTIMKISRFIVAKSKPLVLSILPMTPQAPANAFLITVTDLNKDSSETPKADGVDGSCSRRRNAP